MGLKDDWHGISVEEALRNWYDNQVVKSFTTLPLVIAWGIWMAINASMFEYIQVLPIQYAFHGLRILKSLPQENMEKPLRQFVEEVVDKSGAWAYFNGATQGEPQICGVGGFLYLNDSHYIKFKASLRQGTKIMLSLWI
jgi:hypothetical protein